MKSKIYNNNVLHYFPIYGTTIGVDHKQEKVVRSGGFATHQIFIVNNGTGILESENKTFELEKGDLFFIAANTPHMYKGNDENFTTSWLAFTGNGAGSIFAYYKAERCEVYKNKNAGVFEAKLYELYEKYEKTLNVSTLCAMVYSVVIAFFDEMFQKEYSPIEKVFHYLEENYRNPLTLHDILEVYPYSKSKLCRDFAAEYKMSVFEMLIKIRLKHARLIMKSKPGIKIGTVAESCGFNDLSYFCKMYKKEYKSTPKGGV